MRCVLLVAISLLLLSPAAAQRRGRESIVVSIQRFRNVGGQVFPRGPSHLYAMRPNGKGLHQLTFGSHFDIFPEYSADKRRLLFWRSKSAATDYPNSPLQLYSMDIESGRVKRLPIKFNNDLDAYPGSRLATSLAKWGWPSSKFNWAMRKALVGDDTDTPLYTQSGDRAIVRPWESPPMIVDLATKTVTPLPMSYRSPCWLNEDTIVTAIPGSMYFERSVPPSDVAFLNRRGRLQRQLKFRLLDGSSEQGGSLSAAYPLKGTKTLIWQAHHSMSDGGYDFSYLLDLNRRTARQIPPATIEALSAYGHRLLDASFKWVGGYKQEGAAKLCRLSVWDTRSWKRRRVGPRWMDCFGAAFVPANP